MDERLAAFLDHARTKGLDLSTIRQLLMAKGWKEEDVAEAFAFRELEMSVPVPSGASSAREVFRYLVAFLGLYTWLISLIVLTFTYVNLTYPDPTVSYGLYVLEWAYSAIRQSIAAILVAFPVFLIVWRGLLREIDRNPEKAQSRIRYALTYVSLFVGAVTLVSDVITLIYFLLEGELTTRFVLKVLALFVITGAAFVYLAWTLRARPEEAS